ncbi:hypothetical protein P186_0519 [Pyrobaculum ferrireducens]|uniref:Uncharacterized protein n=1 Tax=Pyrobaculum ferrireducens TaxID=1104324 RepID=G7VH68_9CREN|nr:hypothetical protein P186_0519 [Pyrobaculum ferrireducens]
MASHKEPASWRYRWKLRGLSSTSKKPGDREKLKKAYDICRWGPWLSPVRAPG